MLSFLFIFMCVAEVRQDSTGTGRHFRSPGCTQTREDPCGLAYGQNHRPVRHRQQHKRDKRHPGGAVRQPHISRDHKQHNGPCPSGNTELEKPTSGPGVSNCMA